MQIIGYCFLFAPRRFCSISTTTVFYSSLTTVTKNIRPYDDSISSQAPTIQWFLFSSTFLNNTVVMGALRDLI